MLLKNSLSRVGGFTPEQALLGKSRTVPGSLTSDESASSHVLAESDTPEGLRFGESLCCREQARRSFVSADNDSSFRRALLRRTRPSRDIYQKEDWVLYGFILETDPPKFPKRAWSMVWSFTGESRRGKSG